MARSAERRRSALLAPALLVAVCTPVLVGCDSTFQQNARAKLSATRELASRSSQVVAVASEQVRVDDVALLRDRRSTAVVVQLTNTGPKPQTDVPISVGVRRRGEEVLLNKAPELPWFQTHVPAIAAGGSVTWVFRSPPGRGSKPGDEPLARVGSPREPVISEAEDVPQLSVGAAAPGAAITRPRDAMPHEPLPEPLPADARTAVRVENTSGVPQAGLQVYAVARRGDRVVAAGYATVEDLDRDAVAIVDVPLTGDPGAAPIQSHAIATTFR